MVNIIMGAVGLGLLWSVATIGVYITYRVLDVADLSVEGTIVLGASVASIIIYNGGNPSAATLLAALAGGIGGLITALLHTKLKIPPLLSGILTMIALYSVNIRVMNKSANVSLLRLPTVFTGLSEMLENKNLAAITVGLLCTGFVIALIYWLLGTEIGCAVRATGSNPGMAKAQGINTEQAKLIGIVLSNALVGLSGALIAQYLGFSDVQMGNGSIVIGLASLIIGEVLFARRGGLLRAICSIVLGSVLYRIIIALVIEAGMPATDLKLFTAVSVAAALYLPELRKSADIFRKNRKERSEISDAVAEKSVQNLQRGDGQ